MFEKIVEATPAYDHKKEGYGIHGVDLRFILKGERGAVQFAIFTNWHLPNVQDDIDCNTIESIQSGAYFGSAEDILDTYMHPYPADVGYHSPVPQFEGQLQTTEECPYLDGKPCYYDGSGLAAKKMYNILLTEGSEGVWNALEGYYNEWLGEVENNV